jgi:2-polyprenyl-3-methyl-5-hydroxy-6-metoxy-1,4-benzoquinol methylase
LDIQIYWPKVPISSIHEVQYSHEFCRNQSINFCSGLIPKSNWKEYDLSDRPCHLLNHENSEFFLIVTDPLIVICPEVITLLCNVLERGYSASGPVFNESVYAMQVANAPEAYHNMETYLDIVKQLADERSQNHLPVDCLDPGCVMVKASEFSGTDQIASMTQVEKHIKGSRGVAQGALVHSFSSIYNSKRPDLVDLIPIDASKILDIGCAAGGYGRAVKALKPNCYIAGVEINPDLAQTAGQYYDCVHIGSIEDFCPREAGFDLVNCGDVLEHLYDPWTALQKLNSLLQPGGYIVSSIPNMGHWSVLLELLHGNFNYVPSGLQCVSHIRWFTRESIIKSVEAAGFEMEVIDPIKPGHNSKELEFIDQMVRTGHGDRDMLETIGYNIRARRK